MDRRMSVKVEEVRAALNEISDPCSCALGVPVGLADLGLIDSIIVDNSRVSVSLLTTSPQCMFVGHFVAEAERLINALPWVGQVSVRVRYELIWDDSRIEPRRREMLRWRLMRLPAQQPS